MRHPRPARGLAVASVAVLAATTFGLSASAAATDEPSSTPVPIVTPDGETFSYVVNARHANPGHTRLAERAVRSAGGVVVQSWPEIGVVVAHSTNGSFRDDVVSGPGRWVVDSVGATRTASPYEGTPEEVAGPRAQRSPSLRAGALTDGATADAATDEEFDVMVEEDPRENEQWDLSLIQADAAHELTDGSADVVVGILDSGIEADHPDLAGQVSEDLSVNCTDAGRPDTSAEGWWPTTSSHGTHVAGTVAAARNGTGIVGVAPGVTMASVKVVNDEGYIFPEYAVCGFMWAGLQGMDVTNNSYYVDPFMYWCEDQPDQYAAKEAVRRAVEFSTRRGVVHAAAAGNAATDLSTNTSDSSSPNDSEPVDRVINSGCEDIPAELDGVVTVSSIDAEANLSSFSNRGLGEIDVAAPGSQILSTVTGHGYALYSGTSMASPHVAGVLALMRSEHPDWSPRFLESQIRAQATDHACGPVDRGAECVGSPAENSFYGDGITNALRAVTDG
ncbi:S8 family serine peptidase [Myceligenerans salitolerans]|uniref:S8 family serine peptidase n=2 Tax=Myceligenerans salitolerans TaxID=1230528 RepID=A0ABS3I9E0_9MICO|nr:S8 family serine peptidase [Myceligenerans salitolerans]